MLGSLEPSEGRRTYLRKRRLELAVQPPSAPLPFTARPDLTPYLLHLTKNTKPADDYSAYENLVSILQRGEIWGSSSKESFIKGKRKATCLMDVPFGSLKYVLTPENSDPQKPRYEPYGVAITKRYAYGKGCRPVLYLSNVEVRELDLDSQVTSDGATWLDRELAAPNRTPLAQTGFGREVATSLDRRRQSLVDMGYATRQPEGGVRAPRDLLQRLEQGDVARVGRRMAAERGLSFIGAKPGEYVTGRRLAGAANLASGRFAMIDDGTGFQLVPWQPVLDKRIGQHITGIARE